MPNPPDRLALLDRLILLHDDLLAALETGNAPDLDAFDDDRESAFAALRALPDDGADPAALRARLEALSERASRAMAALAALRDASGQRLAVLEQGRRGLRGYKTAVAGGRGRGARLGEG
jgi:hypothetical protein